MSPMLALVVLAVGVLVVFLGLALRGRDRDRQVLELLRVDGPSDPQDLEERVAHVTSRLGLLRPAATAAAVLLERVDRDRKLAHRLERAHVTLRPGEYLLVVLGLGATLGGWLWAATTIWVLGLVALLASPVLASFWLDARISRRRRSLEAQLPDLLSSIAASVRGGHPLLRATELLASEVSEPMRSELDRVLAETRLGVPVVDAFDRLAQRSGLEDLSWVVDAIRIQQTVGGKLADLLVTLAEHMREREELRREVKTLTAEGRMSTWLLGGLPFAVGVVLALMSPGYISPLFSGIGLVLLGIAALLVALGVVLITRMVKKVVL